MLSDLAWNTFRNHLILEYEIPKYDGDLGIPNLFVPLDEELSTAKVDHHLPGLPDASQPTLVYRGYFPGADASAGHRVRVAPNTPRPSTAGRSCSGDVAALRLRTMHFHELGVYWCAGCRGRHRHVGLPRRS